MARRYRPHSRIGLGVLMGVMGWGAIAPYSIQAQELNPSSSHLLAPALRPVSLRLPQLITLVVQGNRDLRHAVLERIVQQQELAAAESRFEPNLTPRLSFTLTQQLDSSGDQDLGLGGDRLQTDEQAQISADTLTPMGTTLEVALDPLNNQPVQLTLRQPLLRGFGRRINTAPITQARLMEQRHQLELRQQTMDTITTAIIGYTNLIQQQEAVRIQQQALERRQAQYAIVAALVTAGRRPRVDLVEAEGNIANAERDLQNAHNFLTQANTDVLNLIGSDQPIQLVASLEEVEQVYGSALAQVPYLDATTLLATAYQLRPDYQSAQLAIPVEQVGLEVAQDNQRWQLDVEGRGSLGDNAEVQLGLVLTHPFGDEQLERDRTRRQVNVLQSENQLAQLTTSIRNQVSNRWMDVRSNQLRVEAARRATEAAALQLQGDREKFRRGRGEVTLLDLIQREEALVNAQNAQLESEIAFLNSLIQLEQAVGLTLTTWESQVDFTPLFQGPERL